MTLEEIADKIRSMEIRGAAEIGRQASMALKLFARDYTGGDEGFQAALDEAARHVLDTRPTAVSLRNAVLLTLRGVKAAPNFGEARALLIKNSDEFVARSNRALESIGKFGARRIKDGARVLTHCNSKAALSTLIQAQADGKKLEVFATESRPKRQGHITVRQLAEKGLNVTMIVDSAARYFMNSIDVVVVGADTVASNGAVINKIGTSQIALCAHEARVPVMVCAESFKFSPQTLYGELVEIEEREIKEIADPADFPGVKFRNPVFDATPPEYIDVIITELGVISPYAAYEVLSHLLGENAMFMD